MLIELKNVNKNYQLGKKTVEALKGIYFQIEEGEFVALKGPSGSGKTTLLNMLGALDIPDEGEIIFKGKDIAKLNKKNRLKFRASNLGFIFQDYNLIPELTSYENVEIPLLIENVKNRKEKIIKVIEEVELLSHLEHRPEELSGGQRQRVSIARALVKNPPLILADEPTANLDSKTGLAIIDLMYKLNKSHNITFIIATHDVLALSKDDRIINLIDGKIE